LQLDVIGKDFIASDERKDLRPMWD